MTNQEKNIIEEMFNSLAYINVAKSICNVNSPLKNKEYYYTIIDKELNFSDIKNFELLFFIHIKHKDILEHYLENKNNGIYCYSFSDERFEELLGLDFIDSYHENKRYTLTPNKTNPKNNFKETLKVRY